MSEKVAKVVLSGFISPGLGIVKSWQGIVEIVLRGVILVSLSVVFIAGAVVSHAGHMGRARETN